MDSGTGSQPEGPKGRHRLNLRRDNNAPRSTPKRVTASSAYEEQVGVNRQGEGRPSVPRWYQMIAAVSHRATRPVDCSSPPAWWAEQSVADAWLR